MALLALFLPWLILAPVHSQPEPPLAGSAPMPPRVSEEGSLKAGGARENTTGNPADPPAPFVTVRVRVSSQASVNEELEYRILVENHSPAPAHQVRVRNTMPTNAKFLRSTPPAENQTSELLWKLGTLDGGAAKEIRMTVLVLGTGEVETCSRVQYEHGQTVKTQVAAPLKMRLTAPQSAMLYDTLTFQTDLANSTGAEVNGVSLSHQLPEGIEFLTSKPSTTGDNPITWNSLSIPAGQSKRLEFQASAKRSGEFTIRSTLKGPTGVLQESESKIQIGDIKLGLTVSGPQKRGVNRPTPYLITVFNNGSQTARGVRVTTRLDPSIQVVSASQGGRVEKGDLTWNISQLSPGQKMILQGTMQATLAGTWKNRVEMIADRVKQGVQAETATQFESQNGLVMEIDASADTVEPGGQTSMTVRLVNQGKDALPKVALIFTPPEEIETLNALGPTQGTKQGTQTVFAPVETLEPGKEASFTLTLKGIKAGGGRGSVEWKTENNLSGKEEFSLPVLANSAAPPLP